MEINTSADLKAAIKRLEQQSELQKEIVVEQFHETYESLKPMNLLKSSLNKVVRAPGVVENIINATLGLGAGVFSKKLLIGKSTGILKKLLGAAVEFGVAGLISKNSGSLKSGGINLLSKIFKSNKAAHVNN